MSREYRAVEGEISGTVNTPTNLTTFGAETGIGPVKVPANARGLTEIWCAIGATVDTAADSAGYTLRLSGKGMKSGQQDFIIGAAGGGVTNTGTIHSQVQVLEVEIDVVPNEDITVTVQYTGSTIPANTMGIGLVFEV